MRTSRNPKAGKTNRNPVIEEKIAEELSLPVEKESQPEKKTIKGRNKTSNL